MWFYGMATAGPLALIVVTGFATQALSLAALVWLGLVTARTGFLFLWCVPAVALCAWLGLKVSRVFKSDGSGGPYGRGY